MNLPASPRRPTGLAMAASLASMLLALPEAASAQDPTDSLRADLTRLTQLVDSLRREVERLQAVGAEEPTTDPLAALRAAAEAAAGGEPAEAEPAEQEFVGRQRSLQALNPEISLNADVMGHLNPDDTDAQNFFPREFELSFLSALDPFSRAALFISRHGAGPEVVPFGGDVHEGEGEEEADAHGAEGFGVEEGYVEWVSLPGGFGLKLGRFQQQLYQLNRWHSHALAFQSRSLPHIAFIGEDALAQTGVSLRWLAPFGGGGAGSYEITFEATRSENETLWGEADSPSYLTHVNGFWQLGSSVDVELGGGWLSGNFVDADGSFGRDLFSVDLAFNWIPPARSRQRGLTVRAGWLQLVGLEEHEEEPGVPPEPEEEHDRASGFWSMAEVRLSQSWLVGARLDRARSPFEPDVTQWLVSPTLTWWQSEFVRLRAEYDFLSGIEGGDGTGMFILQATFAMGPHKHATY